MGTLFNTIYLPAVGETGWDDEVNANLTRLAELIVGTVLSPTTITADQDNYAPTGIAEATVLRLSTDAVRSITGITTGTNNRILRVWNIGAFNIILKHDVTSTTTNRFFCPNNADITMPPFTGCALLVYDSVSSRWRVQDVQGDQPTITGPITLGGDVNIYRAVANKLKTDDALDVAGDLSALVNFVAAGRVVLSASIAPTTTGTQNNWAPTGIDTTAMIKWVGTANLILTGLSAFAAAGRLLFLRNNTAFTITLNNEDLNSTAANRFTLPGAANLVLTQEQVLMLYYDGSRWTVVGTGSGGGASFASTWKYS